MSARGRFIRFAARVVLALYPAPFRRTFGADLVDTHVDRYRRGRSRGRALGALSGLTGLADLCWGAAREWADVGREAWRRTHMRRAAFTAARDVRTGFRSLRRDPAFGGTVVLILAIGIGTATAVFSLADAVLLRPFPAIGDAESMVAVYDASNVETPQAGVPFPTFQALLRDSRTLEGLAAYHTADVAWESAGRSVPVSVAAVSGGYFPLIGVRARAGRMIEPADDEVPLGSSVVVVSERVWRREFKASSSVLGQQVRLGPTSFTIIGVAPGAFRGTDLSQMPDFWVPLTMIQGLDLGGFLSGRFSRNLFTTFRGYGWLALVGRLRPGVSPDAVAAEFTQLLNAPDPASGRRRELRAEVVPLVAAAAITDRINVVRFVGVLAGIVALILLLGCLNVATLLLVRTATRARELGICAALGASRVRLLSGLCAEGLLLAGAGGVLGVALAWALMRAAGAFELPGGISIAGLELSIERRVLAFSALATMITTIVFVMAPALRVLRLDPARALRPSDRAAGSAAPRAALIALQVAISLVILVTAGLFIRSLRAGLHTDLGFDAVPLAAATVELSLHGYTGARATAFYEEVVRRLDDVPGIQAAAVANHVPVAPASLGPVRPAGGAESSPAIRIGQNHVTPGYFRALGVPIVAGRGFAATDTRGAPRVVVLSESAARALWPDGQAVGRRIVDFGDRDYTVIGIVRDTRYATLGGADPPYLFYSILQEGVTGKVHVIARAQEVPDATMLIRRAILDVDPLVAIMQPRRLFDQVQQLLMPQRFGSILLALLGFVAVLIAAVGIYASLAYSVAQRTSELGIRIALGAARRDVARLVVWRSALTIAAGIGIGLVAAGMAARAVRHFLLGVAPTDLMAFVGAMFVLVAIAGAAALIPARRAWQVDPVRILRRD